MEDFSDVLIYILLIGASVIGGIYKNYAKKKEEEKRRQRMTEARTTHQEFAPNESSEAPTSVPRSLEDFLRDQFEVEMEPAMEETVIPPIQEVETPHVDEPKLNTVNEGSAAFKETNETLLSDNLSDPDFSITDLINAQEKNPIYENEISDVDSSKYAKLEGFDGAKAVIYSEILKRRYE